MFGCFNTTIDSKKYEYIITEAPTALPIDIELAKNHLKLDDSCGSTSYLQMLINSVAIIAEKYTRKTLLTTEYITYRDDFDCCFELRKSQYQSIDKIEYLVDSVWTEIDSAVYYVEISKDYSKIRLAEDQVWPTDKDCINQSIKITFSVGYGDANTDIPADFTLAMLNHLAYVYENRGDCNTGGPSSSIPAFSKQTYNQYKIMDISRGSVC